MTNFLHSKQAVKNPDTKQCVLLNHNSSESIFSNFISKPVISLIFIMWLVASSNCFFAFINIFKSSNLLLLTCNCYQQKLVIVSKLKIKIVSNGHLSTIEYIIKNKKLWHTTKHIAKEFSLWRKAGL